MTQSRDTRHPASAAGWSPEPKSLELLGDLAGVAWFQVNRDREVVAMSQAMEELTGIPRSKALGRPCIYLSRCHECLQHCGVFEEGRVLDRALTLYADTGAELPVAKSGQVLRDDEGRITGALEVVRLLVDGTPENLCADGGNSERSRIEQALRASRYNRTKAAQELGMSRTTLWRKMREYGL